MPGRLRCRARCRHYNPMAVAEFGTKVYSANGGRTERYEMQFAGGWKVANWVIWANATDGR